MEYVKLGDYCIITSSKRIFANQYVSKGVPFFRSKEIIEKNNSQNISEPLYISTDVYNEIKNKFGVPQIGDVLLTSVGTLGIPYLVKEESFYFKDGNLTWMKNFSKKLSSKYLYYWLSSSFGRISLLQRAIGSSQPAITIEILKKYKIILPSINTQQRIASILSAYDNLIENNNKRIRLLEQMAENLYNEWFVRFRFPGHEKTEFENGLPKEWKFENLFAVADVSYGYAFKSDLFCNDESLNAVVRIRDIQDNHTKTYTSEICDDKYLIEENAILVGMDGLFHMCLWNGEKAYLNQRVVKINSKFENMCNFLLYMSIRPQIKFWEQVIAGTTVAHLGDKHLKKVKVIIPENELLVKANNTIQNLMVEKNRLFKQNMLLSRQRDLLLPRLMSGKLEV